MPLSSTASLSSLVTAGLASVRTRFLGKATDKTSFLGGLARAWSMGLFGIQRTLEVIDRDSPPSNKSSELGLVTWADVSGVPSNLGGYGRNGAVKASGGQGAVTGTATTAVLAGQQLVASDGVTLFQLVGNIVIPATGSFVAVTPGSAGNQAVGDKLTWVTPPTGCDPTVTLSSPLAGGIDQETLPHLFERTRTRWQAPPKGGANVDYKGWAEAVAGVDTAYVYPRRGGSGTVHIVVTAPGSGVARLAGAAVVANVQAAVNLLKPSDVDEALVMTGEMPAAHALTIRASAYLSSGYAWDWDDTGGTWTVASYNAGVPSLTVNAVIPQSLRSAIDNGDQPLIQVVSTTTGAPAVPEQVRVTAYDGTFLVLTLANALHVAPTVGDAVHAGAYAAPLAAQAMLNHVNGLGPSRYSGLADTVVEWQDVASVWGVGGAALATVDSDGSTRLLARLSDTNGLTIAVGVGFPSDQDFVPEDTYTLGPEIAQAARCYVTRAIGS